MKTVLNGTFFKFALGFMVILTLSFGITIAVDHYAGAPDIQAASL